MLVELTANSVCTLAECSSLARAGGVLRPKLALSLCWPGALFGLGRASQTHLHPVREPPSLVLSRSPDKYVSCHATLSADGGVSVLVYESPHLYV